MKKFRAQVRNDADTRWVDGTLFGRRDDAEAEAKGLAQRYGSVTRIVEAPAPSSTSERED